MSLLKAQEKETYIVTNVDTGDKQLNSFLLSLGLINGEKIKLIMKLKKNLIISINDTRYSIDQKLAQAILVK